MKYTPIQVTLDLLQFQEMEAELAALKKPSTGLELTEAEHQEATGILMIRCLQNPNLFRQTTESVDLGKYKAIFVQAFYKEESVPRLLIKFERS